MARHAEVSISLIYEWHAEERAAAAAGQCSMTAVVVEATAGASTAEGAAAVTVD